MIALAEFTVAVNKKEVVAAALPLQEHWLPLSNLDLLLPPLDVGVFFCYKNDDDNDDDVMSFGSMVGVLKKAMAQALVSYYALAGQIVSNPTGEPELLCNNRGVEFFEAYADVELRDLNLYEPDKSIEGKLVPEKKKNEVLSVQVTELKCGSLVVACTFDHRIADAYSINMFLVSWAEMARFKPISLFPSFRRSLLNPRRPLNINSALDDVYIPISTLPPSPTSKESDHDQCHDDDDGLTSRIYYITTDQLNNLQSLASYSNGDNINGSCHKRTKLESFSAFLWKMVACEFAHDHKEKENNKSKTKGKKPHDMISRMGIVVDGRTRLNNTHHEGDINGHNLMDSYFGNVLSIPYGGQNIGQLIKEPLSWVADQVNDLLHDAVTKDHFLSLIDWVEARRPEPAVAKIYCRGSEDGPAFVVSSGQRFPIEKVDFGWGKPVFGSYHFPWGGNAGYVMPMPSPKGNGDWVVYMHMTKRQLDFIEKVASKIFKPLTNDYLHLVY